MSNSPLHAKRGDYPADLANTVREDHLCPVDDYGDVLPDCLVCAALDALQHQAETAYAADPEEWREYEEIAERLRASEAERNAAVQAAERMDANAKEFYGRMVEAEQAAEQAHAALQQIAEMPVANGPGVRMRQIARAALAGKDNTPSDDPYSFENYDKEINRLAGEDIYCVCGNILNSDSCCNFEEET